jgi:predicted tellurium resistance membrane protein TerC
VSPLLRIVHALVAQAMNTPTQLIGGVLCFDRRKPSPVHSEGDGKVIAADTWRAAHVAIADIAMSSTMIAIVGGRTAAARADTARGRDQATLIIFGLATSIPLIIAGSALLMAVDRYPILVWAGAALLGWVAGDIMIKDAVLFDWFPAEIIDKLHYWAAAAGAVFVIGLGYLLRRAHHKRMLEAPLIVESSEVEFPHHLADQPEPAKDKR